MSHHGYATENALVDSEWALAHLDDPNVRFVEVDVDTTAYEQSHLPGAVGWNWTSQLADGIRRDIAGREDFSKLLSDVGDRPGHDGRPVRRQQQLVRRVGLLAAQAVRPSGRPDPQRRAQVLARQRAGAERRRAVVRGDRLPAARARLQPARVPRRHPAAARRPGLALVDVRSPAEFNGEIIAPPGMSETAQRAGHIPGAASIPWAQTVSEDGTFKSAEDLATLYEAKGITPDKDVIAYCRIGERSSHSLVRPARAARLQPSPQLRRIVDRVRQPDRRPDREAGTGHRRLTGSPDRVRPGARRRSRQVGRGLARIGP